MLISSLVLVREYLHLSEQMPWLTGHIDSSVPDRRSRTLSHAFDSRAAGCTVGVKKVLGTLRSESFTSPQCRDGDPNTGPHSLRYSWHRL